MSDNSNREQLEAAANALRTRLADNLKILEQVQLVTPIVIEAEPPTPEELAAEKADPPREVLEANAQALRWRLAWNLGSLRQRWHAAFEWKRQLVKHALPAALVGAGTLLAIGGGTGALVLHARHKRQPLARLRALANAWRHPEKVTHSGTGKSLGAELGRGAFVSVAIMVASHVAERALQSYLPELLEEAPAKTRR